MNRQNVEKVITDTTYQAAAWLTPTAVAFAKDVYDGRRFEDAPVLADMLEADGCPIDEPCGLCGGKGEVGPNGGKLTKNRLGRECDGCDGTGRVPNRLLAHLRATTRRVECDGKQTNRGYCVGALCPQCGGNGWWTEKAVHCRGCHALDLVRGAPEAAGVTR